MQSDADDDDGDVDAAADDLSLVNANSYTGETHESTEMWSTSWVRVSLHMQEIMVLGNHFGSGQFVQNSGLIQARAWNK